jgi:hypothetical protein
VALMGFAMASPDAETIVAGYRRALAAAGVVAVLAAAVAAMTVRNGRASRGGFTRGAT